MGIEPRERWTADRKTPDRFLTTANVNGIIACLRTIVASGSTYTTEEYVENMRGLSDFDFGKYRSSQYNRMGLDIFNAHFAKPK